MENCHLLWIFPWKIVIFHGYVSLPEGKHIKLVELLCLQHLSCTSTLGILDSRCKSCGYPQIIQNIFWLLNRQMFKVKQEVGAMFYGDNDDRPWDLAANGITLGWFWKILVFNIFSLGTISDNHGKIGDFALPDSCICGNDVVEVARGSGFEDQSATAGTSQ